jgi:hypothetical protein
MLSGTMVVNGRGRIGDLRGYGLGQSTVDNSERAAKSVPDIDSGIHLLSALEFMSALSLKTGSAVKTLRAVVKGMGEAPADYSKADRENVFNTLALIEDIHNKTNSFLSTPTEVEGFGMVRWLEVSGYLINHLNSLGVSLYIERWTGPALQFTETPFPAVGPELHSRFISNGARTSLFEDFDAITEQEKALRAEAAKVKVALDGIGFVASAINILKEIAKWGAKRFLGTPFLKDIAKRGLAPALFSGKGIIVIGGVATSFVLPVALKIAYDALTKAEKIPGVIGEALDSLKELISGTRAAAFGVGQALMVGGGIIAIVGGYFVVKNLTD